jgi:hypothetical protein
LNIPVIPLLLIFLISSFLRTFDVLQSTDVSTPGEFFKAYLLEKEAPPPKPFSILLPTITPTGVPAAPPTSLPEPAATLLPTATLPPAATLHPTATSLPPTPTQPPPTPTIAAVDLSTLQPPELPRGRKPALVPVSGEDPAGAQNRFRYIFFAAGAGLNGLAIVLYGINRKFNRTG